MLAGWKTQIGLEWALHQGFTHVFRTNSSSFVDLTKLANLVESLPSHGQALGFQGKMFGYSFLSGAGYLLSRDVVADIVANRHRWNHSLLDDVALSELITEASSVAFGKLPRLDVDSIAKLDAINVAALRAHFHFRLKTNGHASTVALARAFLQRYQQAN